MKLDKNLLIALGLLVCISVYWTYSLKKLETKLDGVEGKYKKHIGESFVLSGDTLVIIDYSMFNETFTLSNGQKISSELVK